MKRRYVNVFNFLTVVYYHNIDDPNICTLNSIRIVIDHLSVSKPELMMGQDFTCISHSNCCRRNVDHNDRIHFEVLRHVGHVNN